MRRLLPLAAILTLATTSTVNAVDLPADFDDFVAVSELKQNSDGLVQDAIGVLPSSELNGTLNRISALFNRSAIRNLDTEPQDPAVDAEVPDNFERGMEAALLDLQDDLSAAVEAFEPDGGAECGGEGQMDCAEAQFIILQLLKHVVADRTIQVWNSSSAIGCGCDDCPPETTLPCTNDSIGAVNDAIDLIPQAWLSNIDDLLFQRQQETGTALVLDRNAWSLQEAVNQFIERVSGVPSIDYRVTGVPSIDP